jgi:hypothetical protein
MRDQRTRTTKDVGLTVQALDREISSVSTSFLCRKHSKEIIHEKALNYTDRPVPGFSRLG